MFTYTCSNNSCTLSLCLSNEYVAHDGTIGVIKVADRLINKYEVKWLTECTYHCYTLLLTEGHLTYLCIHLIGDAKLFKPATYDILLLESCEFVLQ